MSLRCHRFVRSIAAASSFLAWSLSGPQFVAASTEDKVSISEECVTVNRQTLEDFVAMVNRYNSQQLVIADSTIRRFRVSGRVCPARLDHVIQALDQLGIVVVDGDLENARGVIRLVGAARAAARKLMNAAPLPHMSLSGDV